MKYLAELKYFWKFFAPSLLVLSVSLLFSVYFSASVLQNIFLDNHRDNIESKKEIVEHALDDQIDTLRLIINTVRRNDDVTSAALYAFDEVIRDKSHLQEILRDLLANAQVDAAIVAGPNSELVYYLRTNTTLTANALLSATQQGVFESASALVLLDQDYYLSAGGVLESFGQETSTLIILSFIILSFIILS